MSEHLYQKTLTKKRTMDYKAFIFFCICVLIVRVESVTLWNNSLQRRFMWKEMDDTVGDLMDGVMSGARVMKNMLGELLPSSSSSTVRHVNSPYDYLPSETTRVKYIIRSPTGKVMKTIKLRPPKKTIKLMAIPKLNMEGGKYYKPKMKYPNSEEMRKLEKQQERIVEGKVPKKNSEEVLADIQGVKQTKESKPSSAKSTRSKQELKAEKELERQAERQTELEAKRETERDAKKQNIGQKDIKTHAQQDTPQKFQIPKPEKENTTAEQSDVISGHIKEFDDDWFPVQYKPEYHKEVKLPSPFSTIKPFPISHLHTTITNSWPSYIYEEAFKSRPVSKLHTTIIGSRRPQTWVEKPVYEEPEEDDMHIYIEAPKKPSYEVTEYIPEESRAMSLDQEYFQTKARNLAYELAAEASVKEKLAVRPTPLHSTASSSTTTSSTTSSTTEEPNYPAEFLRKYRERTAAAVTHRTPLHYRSNDKQLEDTSWTPSTRNRSYTAALKAPQNSSIRTKSEKWPPEEPASNSFGTEAAASVVVESSAQIQIETTPQPTRSKRRKQMRIITPMPESDEVGESISSSDSTKSQPRTVQQRGNVRFGDKINPDEY